LIRKPANAPNNGACVGGGKAVKCYFYDAQLVYREMFGRGEEFD